MSLFSEIFFLFQKEVVLEWRRKYAISGILLYVLSTVFIVYVSSAEVSPELWNVLFWIIMVFSSVNAVAKSFSQEGGARELYQYSLLSPLAILASKVLYNFILLIVMNTLIIVSFSFVAGYPVEDTGMFASVVGLGCFGFGVALTFISAIAAKTRNGAIFMAILSFPVIIPMLMVLVRTSSAALGLQDGGTAGSQMTILIGIDLVLLGLAMVLFPYLWRD
jgi:heme exporter protein B